jgi:hypothetical protein
MHTSSLFPKTVQLDSKSYIHTHKKRNKKKRKHKRREIPTLKEKQGPKNLDRIKKQEYNKTKRKEGREEGRTRAHRYIHRHSYGRKKERKKKKTLIIP